MRAAEPLPPPPFALELLRNEAEVSLIGLVPETGGRDVIRAALGAGGLERAGHRHARDGRASRRPSGWREALGFGLAVLAELPRAKISVTPGRVTVIAVADSDADRAALEARLRHGGADGRGARARDLGAAAGDRALRLRLHAWRTAPAQLAACSADSAEAAAAIIAAARAAGLAGGADCAVGLGAPSPDWAAAVARGLARAARARRRPLRAHATSRPS